MSNSTTPYQRLTNNTDINGDSSVSDSETTPSTTSSSPLPSAASSSPPPPPPQPPSASATSSSTTAASSQPSENGSIMDNKHGKDKKSYNTFDGGKEVEKANGKMEEQSGTTVSTSSEKSFTLQEALDQLGFGRYQIFLSCIFGMAYIADSMEIMLLSVLSPIMKCYFHLKVGEDSLLTIVVFVGMLIAGGFWGKFGDVYGRKKVMMLSALVGSYFGVMTAFSPTYYWIIICRFLVSLAMGAYPQIFTMYTELIPTSSRSYCIVLIGIIWAFGACLEVLLAMVTLPYLSWRWLLVFTAVPITLFFCLYRVIPESPRYLMTQGRHREALDVLNTIARWNRRELPQGRLCEPVVKLEESKNRIKDLFVPKFLRTTVLLGIIMASLNMAYYGTALLTTSLFDKNDGCHGYTDHSGAKDRTTCSVYCPTLTHSDYMDLFYTSLGDAPGLLVCIALMYKLGRKISLAIQLFLYSLMMGLANICLPRLYLVFFLFVARAMALGSAQGIYLYITEIYPTSIRATGMGWCVTTKSMGVIIAALISSILLEYSSYLAISSHAAVGFIGAVCLLLLPYETRNRDLTDTTKEQSWRHKQ